MKREACVLVVDDQEDSRCIVLACLLKMACVTVLARDGQEGVKRFQEGSFAAVLMDIQMPGLDGYAATRAIRLWEQGQGRDRTPVIALTACAEAEEIERIRDAGCDRHLLKPIRPQQVWDALSPYLGLSPESTSGASERVGEPHPIEVTVDPELSELIPEYLEKRRADVPRLFAALGARDFEFLRTSGHRLRGVAASYGFPGLSEIGVRLEKSAQDQDEGALRKHIGEFQDYLARIRYRVS